MSIPLAIAGCGVMGRRHVLGLKKLQEIGRLRFDLVAVCDPIAASAAAMADLAESLLGSRPATYANPADLPAEVTALDIATAPDLHARIGTEALQAGRHVQMEKPLTLTIAEGRELLRHVGDRKLSVAENYRRDPINRLAKALIDAGVLGRPFLAVQSSSGSGENVVITPWRHLKRACGIAVDMGVHYADILEYLLGPLDTIGGMGAVVDRERKGADGAVYPADAEDLTVGIGRYESGALATLILSMAGRGESHFSRMIYGAAGSLAIPGDRTGSPLKLTLRHNGADRIVPGEELLDLAPDFRLDDTTAALFGGDRITSYAMPWADTDANLLAIEYDDFAGAILEDRTPEVDGAFGLRSLAIAYGFLESDRLGRFVTADELLTSDDLPYQQEIEEARP